MEGQLLAWCQGNNAQAQFVLPSQTGRLIDQAVRRWHEENTFKGSTNVVPTTSSIRMIISHSLRSKWLS